MKWWQQLIVQCSLMVAQGIVTQYGSTELIKSLVPAIALAQTVVAHKGSMSNPNTGEKITK